MLESQLSNWHIIKCHMSHLGPFSVHDLASFLSVGNHLQCTDRPLFPTTAVLRMLLASI